MRFMKKILEEPVRIIDVAKMKTKLIICLKCKRKLTENSEVAFVEGGVLCDKCWKKQPYRKLKNIK